MPHTPFKAGALVDVETSRVSNYAIEARPTDAPHLSILVGASRIKYARNDRSYQTRLVLTEAEAAEWNERAAERARRLEEIDRLEALASNPYPEQGTRAWYDRMIRAAFDWADAILITTPAPGAVSIRIRIKDGLEPSADHRDLLAHAVDFYLTQNAPAGTKHRVVVDPPTDSERAYR